MNVQPNLQKWMYLHVFLPFEGKQLLCYVFPFGALLKGGQFSALPLLSENILILGLTLEAKMKIIEMLPRNE